MSLRQVGKIPAGSSSITVAAKRFSSVIATANSMVMCFLMANDSTLTRIDRCVVTDAANGVFTIYGNANATADTTVGWIIFN